jgi:hypothetical protein
VNNHESTESEPRRFGWRSLLLRQWPYFAMLALALFGVAYTSVTRQSMTIYWVVLAPFFGLISIAGGWRDAVTADERLRLIRTQALHWGGVLAAMYLVFIGDVRQIMSSDVSALIVLTVLALGCFTAGVHTGEWRLSVVGLLLGLSVPAIAWLELSTLLIALVAMVAVAIAALAFFRERR